MVENIVVCVSVAAGLVFNMIQLTFSGISQSRDLIRMRAPLTVSSLTDENWDIKNTSTFVFCVEWKF